MINQIDTLHSATYVILNSGQLLFQIMGVDWVGVWSVG